jgi:thiamine-phosphate pyrophosphorylase
MTWEASPPCIDFNLYLITDRKGCAGRSLATVIEEALKGGARALQLREKDLPGRDLYEAALEMRELTLRYGAQLFINDRVDIALAVNADGVHLGEKSIPVPEARRLLGAAKLIGVSCHCREGAAAARDMGADFITYGPVFYTPSKAAYGPPVGLDSLAEVTRDVRIPVFAIGGINSNSAREAVSAGVRGIALISAILAADDPRKETETLLTLLNATEQREE